MQKKLRDPELEAKIIASYASGKTSYGAATECGCTQTFVLDTLNKFNIPRRSIYSYTRKYIPNEDFFTVINSEERAYVLGFMYADGNNYVRGTEAYEVSIGLQIEDKPILERIRDLLSPKSPLKFTPLSKKNPEWEDQYKLKINSKLMTQQLTALGCISDKSLVLTFPTWLTDPELQRHFIRGYFDGDGSLYAKKPTITGQVDWGWSITSTNSFCSSAKIIIHDQTDIHCSQGLKHAKLGNHITASLSIGGNLQIRQICEWMYRDSNIHMPRKYDKFQEFLRYVKSRK